MDSRVLDRSGQQIAKLKVDGKCGPLTLAAITAAQKALNLWRGSAIDGRFDAFKDGSASLYKGPLKHGHLPFSSMYVLAQATNATPDAVAATATLNYVQPGTTPFDIFSLPDPLRTSLISAALDAAVGIFAGFAKRNP